MADYNKIYSSGPDMTDAQLDEILKRLKALPDPVDKKAVEGTTESTPTPTSTAPSTVEAKPTTTSAASPATTTEQTPTKKTVSDEDLNKLLAQVKGIDTSRLSKEKTGTTEPQREYGLGETLLAKGLSGATFNTTPYLLGAQEALGQMIGLKGLGTGDLGFTTPNLDLSKNYEEAYQKEKALQEGMFEQSPWLSTGAEIAGGIATIPFMPERLLMPLGQSPKALAAVEAIAEAKAMHTVPTAAEAASKAKYVDDMINIAKGKGKSLEEIDEIARLAGLSYDSKKLETIGKAAAKGISSWDEIGHALKSGMAVGAGIGAVAPTSEGKLDLGERLQNTINGLVGGAIFGTLGQGAIELIGKGAEGLKNVEKNFPGIAEAWKAGYVDGDFIKSMSYKSKVQDKIDDEINTLYGHIDSFSQERQAQIQDVTKKLNSFQEELDIQQANLKKALEQAKQKYTKDQKGDIKDFINSQIKEITEKIDDLTTKKENFIRENASELLPGTIKLLDEQKANIIAQNKVKYEKLQQAIGKNIDRVESGIRGFITDAYENIGKDYDKLGIEQQKAIAELRFNQLQAEAASTGEKLTPGVITRLKAQAIADANNYKIDTTAPVTKLLRDIITFEKNSEEMGEGSEKIVAEYIKRIYNTLAKYIDMNTGQISLTDFNALVNSKTINGVRHDSALSQIRAGLSTLSSDVGVSTTNNELISRFDKILSRFNDALRTQQEQQIANSGVKNAGELADKVQKLNAQYYWLSKFDEEYMRYSQVPEMITDIATGKKVKVDKDITKRSYELTSLIKEFVEKGPTSESKRLRGLLTKSAFDEISDFMVDLNGLRRQYVALQGKDKSTGKGLGTKAKIDAIDDALFDLKNKILPDSIDLDGKINNFNEFVAKYKNLIPDEKIESIRSNLDMAKMHENDIGRLGKYTEELRYGGRQGEVPTLPKDISGISDMVTVIIPDEKGFPVETQIPLKEAIKQRLLNIDEAELGISGGLNARKSAIEQAVRESPDYLRVSRGAAQAQAELDRLNNLKNTSTLEKLISMTDNRENLNAELRKIIEAADPSTIKGLGTAHERLQNVISDIDAKLAQSGKEQLPPDQILKYQQLKSAITNIESDIRGMMSLKSLGFVESIPGVASNIAGLAAGAVKKPVGLAARPIVSVYKNLKVAVNTLKTYGIADIPSFLKLEASRRAAIINSMLQNPDTREAGDELKKMEETHGPGK